MLPVAVLLVGIYLIVSSQEPVGATFTLIIGLVVAVLALLSFVPILPVPWRRDQAP